MDEAFNYARRLPGQFSHLERLGLLEGLRRLSAAQPSLGLATIRELPDGLWEPDETGDRAMIVPVCVSTTFELWNLELSELECIDLIAFRSTAPADWLWRTGNAWALGEDLIRYQDERPVRVVSTPLAWLKAGGDALCVLDWSQDSPAWPQLRGAGDLEVDDWHLRDRLEGALKRSIRMPRMRVGRHAR